jgi:hypothetical protein
VSAKINPEAKAAILAVLRNPNIKQVKHRLSGGPNRFCASGCIAQAFINETGKGYWSNAEPPLGDVYLVTFFKGFGEPENQTVRLPEGIYEWMGCESGSTELRLLWQGWNEPLETLNDIYHLSLETIAQLIEEQW